MHNGFWAVGLIEGVVKGLLLIGTNRLCGYSINWGRVLAAAVIDGGYSAASMLFRLRFLSSPLWKILFLGMTVVIAFGAGKSCIYRTVVFLLLNISIGGISVGIGESKMRALLLAACCICLACIFIDAGTVSGDKYIPIELTYQGRHMCVKALHDTGNMLRDPFTGRSVLIVGADIAQNLFGLTQKQLRGPTETVCRGFIPGLRVIPYKTIGQNSGFLLAVKLQNVSVGGKRGSYLVACSPEIIGHNEGYQALVGGIL